MASTVTVNKDKMRHALDHGGTAYGTVHIHKFSLLLASGIMADSDSAVALAADAVVALGILPAGTKILDAFYVLKVASGEVTTADIGFEYVDGATGTPAADQDALFDGADLDGTPGVVRKTTAVSELVLEREAYITFKNLGNAQASGLSIDIFVIAEVGGQK